MVAFTRTPARVAEAEARLKQEQLILSDWAEIAVLMRLGREFTGREVDVLQELLKEQLVSLRGF